MNKVWTKNKLCVISGIVTFIVFLFIWFINKLTIVNWALVGFLLVTLFVGGSFWIFEKSSANPRQIVLIANLAAIAAALRVASSAIGSFQPATFIVMMSGYVFGAQNGFMVGLVTAIVSNMFLGQGPWTPWQMLAWGICGLSGGVLGKEKEELQLIPFIIFGVIAAFIFGLIMNFWHWVAFVYPLNLRTFIATIISSFPFDTIHAIGNTLFAILFGKTLFGILVRFKQ